MGVGSASGTPPLWYQYLLPSELWYVYIDEHLLIPQHFTSNQIAAVHELLLPQEWVLLIITIAPALELIWLGMRQLCCPTPRAASLSRNLTRLPSQRRGRKQTRVLVNFLLRDFKYPSFLTGDITLNLLLCPEFASVTTHL